MYDGHSPICAGLNEIELLCLEETELGLDSVKQLPYHTAVL